MTDLLIVDGYNIVNAWPQLIAMQQVSLDAARDTLLRILADYSGYSGTAIWLVFDAYMVKNAALKDENINGVRVVFTANGDTADAFIERELSALLQRQRRLKVRVATSDRVEQGMILGMGAIRMSARELELEIEQTRKQRNYAYVEPNRLQKKVLIERLQPEVADKMEKLRRKKD